MPENTVDVAARKIPVRGLTRREVREFRNAGMDLNFFPPTKADEVMDWVLLLGVCPGDATGHKESLEYLEDIDNAESLKVFRRIMDLTFGRKVEEKNS